MITRRTAHTGFALFSLMILGALGWQWLQVHSARQLASALSTIPDSLEEPDPDQPMREHPSVQLATGSALAEGGNLEEAERTLNKLISTSDDQRIVITAQYNLANAYLRQTLLAGEQTSSQTLPMVELAKQRYRDLLHQAPDHWDARFNLERALHMAPEGTDSEDEGRNEPLKSVNVIVPGFEKKDLP